MSKSSTPPEKTPDQIKEELVRDSHAESERARLEGEVFLAVNNLRAHMGCAAFYLPGKINPHLGVYAGEPQEVAELANGAIKGRR